MNGERRQPLGEKVGIARFIVRRIDAADHAVLRVLQRRLDLYTFGGALHLAPHAERAQLLGMAREGVEVALARREMQDAARQLVVANAGLAPQPAQALAAVGG